NGSLGEYPNAGLVQGSDGNFYGTTSGGGENLFYGSTFKMTPSGILTTLVSFYNYNGEYPDGSLIQGGDGNFYGTTYNGGEHYAGTVFKMTPSGTLTTLVSFDTNNGANPWGALAKGGDGNFYGT